MKTKKLLSVILAAIMVISCFGITSFATDAIYVDALSYDSFSDETKCAEEDPYVRYYGGGQVTYKVTVPTAGEYNLTAQMYSTAAQYTWIIVNGVKAMDNVGSDEKFLSGSFAYDFGALELKAGENTITFYNGGSSWLKLSSFTLTPVVQITTDENGVVTVQAEGYDRDSSTITNTIKSADGFMGYYLSDTLIYNVSVPKSGEYKIVANVKSATAQYAHLKLDGTYIAKNLGTFPEAASDFEYATVELTKDTVYTLEFINQGGTQKLYMDYFRLVPVTDYVTVNDDGSVTVQAEGYDRDLTTAYIDDTYKGILKDGNFIGYYAPGGNTATLVYNVDVPVSGEYTVVANVKTSTGQWASLKVNGTAIASNLGTFPSTASDYTYGIVELSAGETNTFEFINAGGTAWLYMDYFKLVPTQYVTVNDDGSVTVEAEGYDRDLTTVYIDDTFKGLLKSGNFIGYYAPGGNTATLVYNVEVPVSGEYTVVANVKTSAGQWASLKVNGTTVASNLGTFPSTASDYTYGIVELSAGETNTFEFINAGGTAWLYMDYFKLVPTQYVTVNDDGSVTVEAEGYDRDLTTAYIDDTYKGLLKSGNFIGYYAPGGNTATLVYNVSVPKSGEYTIVANVKTSAGQWASLKVNDVTIASGLGTFPSTASDYTYGTVELTKDAVNKIEFINGGGGSWLYMDYFKLVPTQYVTVNEDGSVTVQAEGYDRDLTTVYIDETYKGLLESGDFIGYYAPGGNKATLVYNVDVPASGEYKIVANVKTSAGQYASLKVNNTAIASGIGEFPSTASDFEYGTVELSADETNTFEFINEGGSSWLYMDYFRLVPVSEADTPLLELLLESGQAITVDTSECLWGTETVFAAIYKNNKLVKTYMETATGSTVVFHLDKIVLEEGESISDYTFKLFIWDNMLPVVNEPVYEIGATTEIYVETDGSDENDGTMSSPVTLAKAQELAGEAAQYGDVVVNIGAGEYTLTSPLSFTADNTSSNGSVITYMGDANGQTVINGGKKVENWTESDEISGAYEATVDVSDLRQLWIGENKAVRASSGEISGEVYNTDEGVTVSSSSILNIVSETDMELVWDVTWSRQRYNVNSVSTDGSSTIFVLDDFSISTPLKSTGSLYPFVIENAKAYLDTAGEFYFDKTSKTLYYIPKDGEDLNSLDCYAGLSEGFIDINDADNLTFENLTFKYGTWLRPNTDGAVYSQGDLIRNYGTVVAGYFGGGRTHSQIEVREADNINFKNVDIIHVGSAGISFTEGVTNSKIENCDITDTAAGGIMIGSWRAWEKEHYGNTFPKEDGTGNWISGDGVTGYDTTYDLCDNITVYNNTITDVAYEYGGQSGIAMYYTKNTVIDHNTLTNMAYTGISYGYGWSLPAVSGCTGNKINSNKIDQFVTVMNDGGGIYVLGKSAVPAEIKNNYLISHETGNKYVNGLYSDNGTTGTVFEANVVEDCKQWVWVWADAGDITGVKAVNNYTNLEDFSNSMATDTSVLEITGTVYDTDCADAAAIKNAAGATR